MNRPIIFRAKTLNEGKWVRSSLVMSANEAPYLLWVTNSSVVVDTSSLRLDTLGQYTGVDDINGKRIFEGDILKIDDVYCEVGWNPMQSAFCIRFSFETRLGLRTLGSWLVEKRNTVVVGNIHDSPELLDEKTSK